MGKSKLSTSRARGARVPRLRALLVAGALVTACGGSQSEPAAEGEAAAESDAPSGDDSAAESDVESLELTFTHGGGETGLIDGTLWWAEELSDRSDGAITVDFFHLGTLATQLETLPAVKDGRADSGLVVSAQNPAEFPLWNLMGVPFDSYDPHAAAMALYEMYQQNDTFRGEFDAQNVRVMHFVPYGLTVGGGSEPIAGVDDLAGTRLRAIGHIGAAVEAAGAEPVAMNPNEVYESVQRGVLDGYIGWPFEVVPEYGIHEVATEGFVPGVGHYANAAVTLRADVWEGLSDAQKDLIDEVSRDLQEATAIELLMELEETSCEAWTSGGASIEFWSDQETERFADLLGDEPLDDWRQSATDAGHTAEEVDAFYTEYHESYEAHAANSPYESGVESCASE